MNEEQQKVLNQIQAFELGEKIKPNTLFQICDALARIGGFIHTVKSIFSFFVKHLNHKLYTSQVISDTYLLKKNDDFCHPDIKKGIKKTPVSQKNGSKQINKKPKTFR